MNKFITTLILAISSWYSFAQSDTVALAKCATIKQSDKRLECFDNLSKMDGQLESQEKVQSQIKTSPTTSPSVTAKKAAKASVESEPNVIKEDAFGKEQAILQELQKQEKSITAQVVKVSYSAYKKFTVTLDNGQRWKQTDYRTLSLKPNDKIIINRGALNSFLLKKQNSNSTRRVKRVD